MARHIKRKADLPVSVLGTEFRKQHGGFTLKETEEVVKGIYIPDFAERWVRDSNVYLLGMLEMHVGAFGSGKSTQLMRMGRIFLDAGGLFFYVETEGKYSPAFITATMGDRAFSDRFNIIHARTMGDAKKEKKGKKEKRTKTEEELDRETEQEMGWFNHVYNIVQFCKDQCPDAPVLIAIDTITSAPTEEHQREFHESDGQLKAASTKQLRRAKVIKDWLESVCSEVRNTNIMVACSNHVTTAVNLDNMPSYGKPETQWSGGSALGQRSAVIMEYARSHAKDDSVETQSNAVKITVRKNSNGTGLRDLKVVFDYRHLMDEASGKPVLSPEGEKIRVVNWQWGQATVNLLSSFFNPDHMPEWERRGPAECRDVIRMTVTGSGTNKRYSLRGFDEEQPDKQLWSVEQVPAPDLVRFIESSGEAQLSLQNVLLTGVVSHSVYTYLDEEDDVGTQAKEKSDEVNEAIEENVIRYTVPGGEGDESGAGEEGVGSEEGGEGATGGGDQVLQVDRYPARRAPRTAKKAHDAVVN